MSWFCKHSNLETPLSNEHSMPLNTNIAARNEGRKEADHHGLRALLLQSHRVLFLRCVD